RRAEGVRRTAYQHAGERAEDLVDHAGGPANSCPRALDPGDGSGIERGGQAMYDFTYQKPGSVTDAAAMLAADADAKAMAGGMTLIPVLKQRLNKPSVVV